MSLARLNNSGLYFDNAGENIYDKQTSQILGNVHRWGERFVIELKGIQEEHIVSVVRLDDTTFEQITPPSVLITAILDINTWHTRLGHLNFVTLMRYLTRLNMKYSGKERLCDSCERAKAQKQYNREPQERATRLGQYIHTDMVGPITPTGFLGERYFWTFTEDCQRITDVYIGKTRDEWLSHLKTQYSRLQTLTGLQRPVERIRTDFATELRSKLSDKWMLQHGITYEPSAPYSQEQNGVAERAGRTIMDSTRATMLDGDIRDDL